MKVSESINVFVSYSWAMEKETNIVDDLGKLCPQRGITLIRDNDTLKHGDLIEEFMKELSKGDHVITIFSKPYFQSKWCMYELLKIYQRGDFQERTHPVIADECDLQDEDYRLQVVNFWHEQFETAEDKLKKYDPLSVSGEYKHLKLYRDIYRNINEILNFAAGRVTTPLAELQKQNYEQLLADLSPINTSNQENKNNTPNQHHLPVQPDNKFIAFIKDTNCGRT